VGLEGFPQLEKEKTIRCTNIHDEDSIPNMTTETKHADGCMDLTYGHRR
jgi:hypothetical protein